LVLYQNLIENKYYLTDGYPPIEAYQNEPVKQAEIQAERDENMQKIAPEWNKFIEQMKKEGRYKD
jgi:hypothetical protein